MRIYSWLSKKEKYKKSSSIWKIIGPPFFYSIIPGFFFGAKKKNVRKYLELGEDTWSCNVIKSKMVFGTRNVVFCCIFLFSLYFFFGSLDLIFASLKSWKWKMAWPIFHTKPLQNGESVRISQTHSCWNGETHNGRIANRRGGVGDRLSGWVRERERAHGWNLLWNSLRFIIDKKFI